MLHVKSCASETPAMKKRKLASDIPELRQAALALLLQSLRVHEKGIVAIDEEEYQLLPDPSEVPAASWTSWKLIEVRS